MKSNLFQLLVATLIAEVAAAAASASSSTTHSTTTTSTALVTAPSTPPGTDPRQALAALPKCSVECIKNSTAKIGCGNDLSCQCNNLRKLVVESAPCLVRAGCEMEQMVEAATLVVKLCEAEYKRTHNGSLPDLSNVTSPTTKTSSASSQSLAQLGGTIMTIAITVGIVLL